MSDTDYDVIVIGAGGAGLAAASAASEEGARVLVVEAADRTGGSTALSGGVFYAAGTSLQREAGIEDDTPEAMFAYYMWLNQYKLEPGLVRRLCEDATPAFEWLRRIGVAFDTDGLYASGVDKVRRGHRAAGMGAAIAEALEGSFAGRGVDVALSTRVEDLLVEEGAVRGIRVAGEPVRARSVIVASGGFGANPDMLAALYPDAARHGDLHWYIGADTCRGDGIAMGRKAGAAISHPDNRGLLLLTPGFAKELEVYLPGWLVMVNRLGLRFIDETIEYSVLSQVMNAQPERDCFAIFDEASRAASKSTPERPAPNWEAERLLDHVADGLVERADSLDALAGKLGVPAAALRNTVAQYNADVAHGEDRAFFKPPDMLRTISEPPFYAARIRAAIVCWTGTGLRIDTGARVLGTDNAPVPGLYAAGETTGGMFGECYAAGGASIANAVVFGRIAGANAARATASQDRRS